MINIFLPDSKGSGIKPGTVQTYKAKTMLDWETSLILYVVNQRARNIAARTIDNRTQLIRRIHRVTETESPLHITPHMLLLFIGRGIAASSMQRERSDLQSFFRWLKDDGHRDDDPSLALPKVHVPRRRPRPFTLDQIERMLSTGAYRRTRVMIMLGYLEGMRAHEIAKVHGRDIDHDTMTIRVVGKGGVTRHVPIAEQLRAEIPRMPSNGYWFPARGTNGGDHIHWRSVSDLLRQARERSWRRRTRSSLRFPSR